MISRRQVVLAGAASVAGYGLLNKMPGGDAAGSPTGNSGGSGRQRQVKVPFGAAVKSELIEQYPGYRNAVISLCQQIVPESALKWNALRPARGRFTFEYPDRLIKFAQNNGLNPRGHTLVWYAAMPDWTNEISSALEAERELVQHIERVVAHYKGVIRSWDVVNEPLAESPRHARELRPCIWHQYLGPRYIEIALRTAASVDPTAQLVINEFNVETAEPAAKAKRAALLTLVRDLLGRGAPIKAVGLQGHLKGEQEIDQAAVSELVASVRAANVEVLVTELDVIDKMLPADIAQRDSAVADRASEFLSAIFAAATPTAVLTWGVSDSFTWVPMYYKRADGLPNRPLPLDAEYKPKPLLQVIQRFCSRQA
jgi:endo-1,4-beta-xylanase